MTGEGVALAGLRSAGLVLGGRAIIKGVSLEVFSGEILALVGPNGAGKSSILGLLSGDVKPTVGRAEMETIDMARGRPRDLARKRAVLTQVNQVSFPFTVREIVEMGRAPWNAAASRGEDLSAIEEAYLMAGVSHLAERIFNQLSEGEKARVSLARVLAQKTPLLLLDEPTAALDLRHQEAVMGIIRSLADSGRAVAVVIHDLSLAARYSDRVAMVVDGQIDSIGPPNKVLVADRVKRVYGIDVEIQHLGNPPRPIILPSS